MTRLQPKQTQPPTRKRKCRSKHDRAFTDFCRHFKPVEYPTSSYEAIGTELNLTKERVRQIERKALYKLFIWLSKRDMTFDDFVPEGHYHVDAQYDNIGMI